MVSYGLCFLCAALETSHQRPAAHSQSVGEWIVCIVPARSGLLLLLYILEIACFFCGHLFFSPALALLIKPGLTFSRSLSQSFFLFYCRWEPVSQKCSMVVHWKSTVPRHGFIQTQKVKGKRTHVCQCCQTHTVPLWITETESSPVHDTSI